MQEGARILHQIATVEALQARVDGTEPREINECKRCCDIDGLPSRIAESKCRNITASGVDAVALTNSATCRNVDTPDQES